MRRSENRYYEKKRQEKKNIGPVDVPQKLKKIKYIQLAHVGVLLKLKGGKICQQPDIHHENKCLFWIFLMQWKVSLSYLWSSSQSKTNFD